MVPTTYTDWRHCIEVDCGVKLTPEFIEERLAVYADVSCAETQRFISLYGETHRKNIVQWLNASR